jgi:hypothetical protein
MKTTGEDVGRRIRILFVACAFVFLALQALAQDVTITNFDQLAQVALSANYSFYLPFSPWDWRAYPIDWPLWCDSTSMCLDSLPTATNFINSADWSNVPLASVTLTKDVISGVVTVSADGTNVIATIPTPSGYQPGASSEDHWLWAWYVSITNALDSWGITPGQAPAPAVTLRTFLADSNAYYSVYETNLEAEAAAVAAAATTASGDARATGSGGFMAMDEEDDLGGDPCTITNEAVPFSVVSVTPDGSGNVILVWQSCTDHVYVVQTTGVLPATSWTDVAWMFGTDQQTTWIDTNAVGLAQEFYQVVRGNPNTLNNGIPYGWAVTYGLDPLDPNLASETSTNPWAHGLTNLQVYENPSVLISNNYTTVNDGIPDWWRVMYFGTTNDANSCATCDPDGDGYANYTEFLNGTDPVHAEPPLDVLVNGGNLYTTTLTIPIQPLSTNYPNVLLSTDPSMTNAVLLSSNDETNMYNLADAEGLHYVYFQYADAQSHPHSGLIYKTVTVDRTPPHVEINSPTSTAVVNQAFITLQGVVFDPDPVLPPDARPLKIWINNMPYWDRLGTNIVIQRFPVPSGTNSFAVTIQAVDQAGNTNQATQTWMVNTSSATNAPNLLSANISQTMIVPAVGSIWVEGDVDNPYALVTSIVTAESGDVMTNSLDVLQQHYRGSVPLELGTNQLALIASDAAGNATSNLFTIISADNYKATITSPALGDFASSQSTIVNGYVSATVNSGLPTEADVTSVLINGVAAVLDWENEDENGNVPFATTNAIPLGVPITGQVLTNGDGDAQSFGENDMSSVTSLVIPPAPSQQYQLIHQERHGEGISGYSNGEYANRPSFYYEDCSPACFGENWWSTMAREIGDDVIDTNGPTEQYQGTIWVNAGGHCVNPPQPETFSWSLYSSNSSICVGTNRTSNGVDSGGCSVTLSKLNFFGSWSIDGSGNFPATCGAPWCPVMPQHYYYQGLELCRDWDWGVVSFLASPQYDTNTPVLFTFQGMNYMRATGAPLDLSQVSWRGLSPATWSNDAQTVSYVVSLTRNQQYTLNQDSFDWPYSSYGTILSDGGGVPFSATFKAHWMQWTNFYGKYPVRIIWQNTDITDTTTNSVIVGQQVSLQAVVDPSLPTTSNFTWSVSGYAISNYVVAPDSSSAQVLPLTQVNKPGINFYWVSGGQLMATCTVVLANGTPVSVYAGFTVKQPQQQIGTINTQPTVDANYYDPAHPAPAHLHLGNPAGSYGITFTRSGDSNPYGGTNYWSQVIVSTLRLFKLNNATCLQFGAANSLDQVNPYDSNPPTTWDAPGVPLLTNYVEAIASNSFCMWLMYVPPGTNSIAVPSRAVNWNWSGDAVLSNGVWRMKTGTGTASAAADGATNGFPAWTGVVKGNETASPVSCPP